ncbi:MAG: hypothetical protein ACE5GN_07955 [Waddliaceae bacterium]
MMKKRGNNEGSIYQRKDGRWAAAISTGGGRDSRKRKYIYGKTEQEVTTKLAQALKIMHDNDAVTTVAPSFRAVLLSLNLWFSSQDEKIDKLQARKAEAMREWDLMIAEAEAEKEEARRKVVEALEELDIGMPANTKNSK